MMPATEEYKKCATDECNAKRISMDGTIATYVPGASKGRSRDSVVAIQSMCEYGSSSLRIDSRRSELRILKARKSQIEKTIAELTINKLDLKALPLIGRSQELSTLGSCYSRLCPQHKETSPQDFKATTVKNELVFIQGYSGVGKSTLAQALRRDVSASCGVYVEGKFEFTAIDQPYSGVARAFGDLCNNFKDCPSGAVAKATKTISDTMKEEAQMLMGLIPELSIFLGDGNTKGKTVQNRVVGTSEHDRWKHAFRMLTRILGSHFCAIVIVLDDIQWADSSSLDIMDFLISDVDNPHPLMIIGCYRSNEVDQNSILYTRIQTLQERHEKFVFRITDIELKSFDVDAVNTMIMIILSIDDERKTRELSAVCYKRTLGNPFFVIEFMKMLQAEGLLDFNLGLMKWIWDVSKIEDATMSTANVVDLLQARMRKLSHDTQLLLQHAACLGSSFSLPTLKYVWRHHALAISEDKDHNLMVVLEVVRKERLIESCGPEELRWVHDKVQEAALSLSKLPTPSFQYGIGICLYEGLDWPQLEKQLFIVADLVNKGPVTKSSNLSELNLLAAKKAHKMAAFHSGAKYAAIGIKRLPSDKWTTHRNLTLELHSLGAEMNVALGNIKVAKEYIREVLDQKEYTPVETMRLKITKMEVLGNVELRYSDAVDYGVQVLRGIGHRFVWKRSLVPVQALALVRKTVKRLKKLPVHHFDSIPLMKDPKQKATVNLLTKLSHVAYQANDIFLAFLCSCKVIELTLERGLHHCSAQKCAGLAATVMILKNDHATSNHFCNIAFAIQKRFGRRGAGETIHISSAMIFGYIKPLHESLSLTMDGYSRGLRDGDNSNGISNLLLHYVRLPYIMGRPLVRIAEDCQRISAQVEETKLAPAMLSLRLFWQMILNLQLPPSESSKKLEGERFSSSSKSTKTSLQIGMENFSIGELLLFFGDHTSRTERLLRGEEEGKTYSELVKGHIIGRIETFHRAIAWFAVARRKNGKRKYRVKALRIKKLVAKWAKAGDPNVQHYDSMLSAEAAALNKKYDMADQFYKEAITLAARTGHLQHAALFSERFAEYQMEVHGHRDDIRYHMQQAIKYYTEWGAAGKAEQLSQNLLRIAVND